MMSFAGAPFFVVSAPRSGSTLLRLVLDAHPRLAVPPPGWLFEMVYPYLYSYGDLTQAANLRELAEDMLETPTVRKWPISTDPDRLVAASKEPSFRGLFDALHRLYAESTGKARWGEKSPRDCFWIDEIRAEFPGAKFVHLLRDGRDQAIDLADSTLWPYSPFSAADLWQSYVTAARASGLRLARDAYLEVRYEDLCADPKGMLTAICEFLGEGFDPRMLAHHETASARQWSDDPLHAKTSRPITTEYCGMYRARLPARDRAAIEAHIGDTLRLLGYPVSANAKPIDARLAAQLLNNDRITNPANVPYKRWHEQRRKARLDRGVWRDRDRESLLWAIY
jgi:hypothetical protein